MSVRLYTVPDQTTLSHLLQSPMQSHTDLQQRDNRHEAGKLATRTVFHHGVWESHQISLLPAHL